MKPNTASVQAQIRKYSAVLETNRKAPRFTIQRLRQNGAWRSVPSLAFDSLADAEACLVRLAKSKSRLRIFPGGAL